MALHSELDLLKLGTASEDVCVLSLDAAGFDDLDIFLEAPRLVDVLLFGIFTQRRRVKVKANVRAVSIQRV